MATVIYNCKTCKIGQLVIWPKGANDNPVESIGKVVNASKYEAKHILWSDQQKTYLTDDAAMEYVKQYVHLN
jgi:hypothetical protein